MIDLAALEKTLRDELAQLQADVATSRDDSRPVTLDQQAVGRLSRMDALQVQAMATAADERRKQRLQRIEAALTRLTTDRFGECLRCGDDIEEKRLTFDPTVTLCMTCQKG